MTSPSHCDTEVIHRRPDLTSVMSMCKEEEDCRTGLTQRSDDSADSVDDAIGRHQVSVNHWHLVDVHCEVPLKHRSGIHKQSCLNKVIEKYACRGTDHAELQLLPLQRLDSGVRPDPPADQQTFTQVIPEHGGQLLAVTWETRQHNVSAGQ